MSTIRDNRQDPNPGRLLRRPAVEALTGLRRSALYLRIAEGRFPKPVQLDGRAVAWVADEVAAWVADRIAARDGQ